MANLVAQSYLEWLTEALEGPGRHAWAHTPITEQQELVDTLSQIGAAGASSQGGIIHRDLAQRSQFLCSRANRALHQ